MNDFLPIEGYRNFLDDIKVRITTVRIKAMSAVNSELIQLYWYIGSRIKEKQSAWGSKFLEKLSEDLNKQNEGARGFSVTNLKRMRMLAEMYPITVGAGYRFAFFSKSWYLWLNFHQH